LDIQEQGSVIVWMHERLAIIVLEQYCIDDEPGTGGEFVCMSFGF
jgi:hypothetical protein